VTLTAAATATATGLVRFSRLSSAATHTHTCTEGNKCQVPDDKPDGVRRALGGKTKTLVGPTRPTDRLFIVLGFEIAFGFGFGS